MPRFLRSLETKAVQGDTDANVRWVASGSRLTLPGQAPWLGWSTQRAVTDGYEREPLLFRAIHALAVSISRLPAVLREDDPWYGKILDTTEDPLLSILNKRANEMEFGSAFRYRLVSQLMLSERGVMVERIKTRSGKLLALHLLPVDITVPIPATPAQMKAGSSPIFEWQVRVPGDDIQHVPAEDVCWIRWPHPTDPFSGVTPIRALALTIDTSYAARLYNRRFLAKDGRPGGIIAVKGNLVREEKEELRRRMSGQDNVGETSVVNAEDVNYIDLASRPREMAYKDLRPAMKEEIFTGVGTPESMAGNASGRTFANADAERENWYVDNVMPTAELIGQALSIWTAGGEDDDNVVGYDISKIAVLQRFEKERDEFHLQEAVAGVIDRDEYRKNRSTSLPPMTDKQKENLLGAAPAPAAGPPGAPPPGAPNAPLQVANEAERQPMPAHSLAALESAKAHPLESAARPRGFTRRRTSGLPR